MDAQSLMKTYPFLDELMAETLIRAYEEGYLTKYLKDLPETKKETEEETRIIKGAIVVE